MIADELIRLTGRYGDGGAVRRTSVKGRIMVIYSFVTSRISLICVCCMLNNGD